MKTITRKEIAAATEVSVDTVARNERIWGLAACKSQTRKKPICYDREKANAALIEREIISMSI